MTDINLKEAYWIKIINSMNLEELKEFLCTHAQHYVWDTHHLLRLFEGRLKSFGESFASLASQRNVSLQHQRDLKNDNN